MILKVKRDSSQEEIKASYRKMALELHPDKNKENYEDTKFKKITEAYNFLKKNEVDKTIHYQTKENSGNQRVRPKPQWGAPDDGNIPEQDWSKYTRGFEEVIQLFGKSMKENFGRIIMHEYEQTVKMENMKKQKNLINSQILG